MSRNHPTGQYGPGNTLPVDVIIVDEASMVDLAMMTALFQAAPDHARIILLGDRYQLASVEAGHVLGDLCAPESGDDPAYVVHLRRSFRFADESGIKLLSEAVNRGDADATVDVLAGKRFDDIRARPLPSPEALPAALRPIIDEGIRELLSTSEPEKALEALARFRVLCATRHGPYGVERVNRLIESALAAAGLHVPGNSHFHGRPIIVVRNDYTVRLFNGDVGLLLRDSASGGELRAFFPSPDGSLRRISPARLPSHEPAWAMTVHKSQGSEFDRVLLILPERDSPLLTRELIYTGITRAKKMAELWFLAPVLRNAICRETARYSGLQDALRQRESVG